MGKLVLILCIILVVLIIRKFLLQQITVVEKRIFIFLAIIVLTMVFLYISLFIQPYSLLRIIKGRQNYAISLLQKARVEAINQEAERMFDDFYRGDHKIHFVSEEELAQYPCLLNFAYSTGISIAGSKKSMRANIVIKYGTHQMADFIYIFDRRTPPPYFVKSEYPKLEKLTENIFLTVP